MDSDVACETEVRRAESASELAEVVASLRAGTASVVVGVVGPGLGRARAAVGDLATVYPLSVPPTTALDAAAAAVFPVPDRCVVVVREQDSGWDLAVAPPGTIADWALPPPSPPPSRRRYPLEIEELQVHTGAVARTLVGELVGAGVGIGTAVLLSERCGSTNCVGASLALGAYLGSWTGALLGAATMAPSGWPVAGALGGSVASVTIVLAAAGITGDTELAVGGLYTFTLVVPPLGAGIALGTWGDGPAATVSWRW